MKERRSRALARILRELERVFEKGVVVLIDEYAYAHAFRVGAYIYNSRPFFYSLLLQLPQVIPGQRPRRVFDITFHEPEEPRNQSASGAAIEVCIPCC